MATSDFTAESLPEAVKALLEMNNYEVHGPVNIYGAEIDLVATHKSDPLAATTYLEVTVEYVNNDKYGKDVGKLAMIGNQDPGCRKLIVSSRGFSEPVRERAKQTGISTFTYDELFEKFQRFGPYVQEWLGTSDRAREVEKLWSVYEKPCFDDTLGRCDAIDFLDQWRSNTKQPNRWLIIVGEYGTGKTALTRVLHRRWLDEYRQNPSLPIPFRIELRDFTRQFDSRSLLHHFLDNNRLVSLPIDFVEHLLRIGRVLILLDGYDEMAQYMHARERRACLEALASLSAGGARGILTSRPNYFSEAEELQLFEVLYRSIERERLYIGSDTALALERESSIDDLLGSHFLNRYERSLADLTDEQTEALVKRALENDPVGQDAVIAILQRVLRSKADGSAVSLSGKPVIVTYLLEIVESLKDSDQTSEPLSEWKIYRLIIDKLMLRDLERTPDILPQKRRAFLQHLALWLSAKGHQVIQEDEFRDLVLKDFNVELRRAGVQKREELERLFADLRTSATLTRGSFGTREGWRFSHNSLREYLCAESMLSNLQNGLAVDQGIQVTDAMRAFASSLDSEHIAVLLHQLASRWANDLLPQARGSILNLLWDGIVKEQVCSTDSQSIIAHATDNTLNMDGVMLNRINMSSLNDPVPIQGVSFNSSQLTGLNFANTTLNKVSFDDAILDGLSFACSVLSTATFRNAVILDVDYTAANIDGADFTGVDSVEISIIINGVVLLGDSALGYLKYGGAILQAIPTKFIYQHHPKFSIVDKILLRLSEQAIRQERGLTQRGEAHKDPVFARSFVNYLKSVFIIEQIRDDQVGPTPDGREIISQYIQGSDVPPLIMSFLDENNYQ